MRERISVGSQVSWIGGLGLAALVLGSPLDAHAQAQTCVSVTTAFLDMSPTQLEPGDQVTLDVMVQNASRTQPGGTFVTGQVGGDVCMAGTCDLSGKACLTDAECTIQFRIFLACLASNCAVELPGTLVFQPTGGNGCLSSMAGVMDCAIEPGNPNRVLVTLAGGAANAIPIGANSEILVAQVRAIASIPISEVLDPLGDFEVRVDGLSDFFVTNDPLCVAPVSGGSGDSSSARFPPPPVPSATPLGLAFAAAALAAALAWRSRRGAARVGG
jgi:hypothetical protein